MFGQFFFSSKNIFSCNLKNTCDADMRMSTPAVALQAYVSVHMGMNNAAKSN